MLDLPEDAPLGAVALLSYKYNDRKNRTGVSDQRIGGRSGSKRETAPDERKYGIGSGNINTGASGKTRSRAKSSFHLITETSESIGEEQC